ncbi:YxeA family protein [Lactobacillus sp. ESL0684]|uniref:YxeA family protein n=1 Tax=Lactobacillus sp. ESL0684 TaxID=2983213 RepID=UPI0023F6ED22|nr:YxeA family protein [Lactobacillus sp. ESL0684]WEV43081.1 YxeA family protein [Lactobacillus sp. ESL0684]
MKKFLLTVLGIIVVCCGGILLIHNQYTDYINPLIDMEISYAKVPKHTQKYRNVQAVDNNGKKLPYKIKYIGGYDPGRQYIYIEHKGQYVKQIEYLPKDKFPGQK